jgi:hypothetical protein
VAWADFLLGTLALAFLALLGGELSTALAFRVLRKHLGQVTAEAARYQQLSMEALAAGDRQVYQAANRLANEAFGKSFFMQLPLSAAFLWPAALVLAWMSYRFSGIAFLPIPFTGYSVGFVGVFLPVYFGAYLLLKKVIFKLPSYRRFKEILSGGRNPSGPPLPQPGNPETA